MMHAILFTAALANASPCDDSALQEGPLPARFGQADAGVVRRACPRTEAAIGVGARANIDAANFYGNLRGAAVVEGSAALLPRLELFFSTEPVAYQLVIQSFEASHLGYGDSTLGGTLVAVQAARYALSVTTQADLPTAAGYYQHAFPIGFATGLLGVVQPIDRLRLHGGAVVGTDFAITKADPDPRARIASNVGADVRFFDWFSLTADVSGQVLHRGGLDYVAVGVGPRFAIYRVGVDVFGVVPVAGDEPNLFTGGLRVSYRF